MGLSNGGSGGQAFLTAEVTMEYALAHVGTHTLRPPHTTSKNLMAEYDVATIKITARIPGTTRIGPRSSKWRHILRHHLAKRPAGLTC